MGLRTTAAYLPATTITIVRRTSHPNTAAVYRTRRAPKSRSIVARRRKAPPAPARRGWPGHRARAPSRPPPARAVHREPQDTEARAERRVAAAEPPVKTREAAAQPPGTAALAAEPDRVSVTSIEPTQIVLPRRLLLIVA